MNELDEGQWARANGGKEIDAYYLKEHLSTVITVNTPALKKARRWREGKGNPKFGYTEEHLADAFMRYLNRRSAVEGRCGGGNPLRPGVFHPTHPTHPTREAKNDRRFNNLLCVG